MGLEKKFYVDSKSISSPYFKKDEGSSILVASDIHYQPNVNKELYTLLIRYAQETKPSYIVMPGDQVETIDFIDDTKERQFFEYFIKSLSEICPVIIIPGNHEMKDYSHKIFGNRSHEDKDDYRLKSMRYFDSLNRFDNVYFLNNEKVTFSDATFFGFNPRLSSYEDIKSKEVEEEFIEDFIKSGLSMAADSYNILLTHSPLQIIRSGVYSAIPDFENATDLVISGHLHDGYLPKRLDKKYGDTNVGLFFTPLVYPSPGVLCRGVHDFGRGYVFVSQGFRKWTADLAVMNAFERITANDIENLYIKKADSKDYEDLGETKPFVK